MPYKVIRTERDLEDAFKLLSGMKFPLTLQWQKGAGRSLDQNSLQFKWALEAAHQRGDMTADEVQREWKLRYGIPILRAENDEFRLRYDKAIMPLSYAEKLDWMRDLPVTRIMTVPQMQQYLDTVQRECAEQGIRLTDTGENRER